MTDITELRNILGRQIQDGVQVFSAADVSALLGALDAWDADEKLMERMAESLRKSDIAIDIMLQEKRSVHTEISDAISDLNSSIAAYQSRQS